MLSINRNQSLFNKNNSISYNQSGLNIKQNTGLLTRYPGDKISFSGVNPHTLCKKELRAFIREAREIFEREIVPSLGLKNKPKLKIKHGDKGAGTLGYNCLFRNEIHLSSDILTDPNLVRLQGVRNGEKVPIMDEFYLTPLIIQRNKIKNLAQFLKDLKEMHGFSEIKSEPLTKKERKKWFLQFLFHESRHSYQEEVKMKVEGIGIRRVLAQNIARTKKALESQGIEGLVKKIYIKILKRAGIENWKKLKPFENTIPRDSEQGRLAHRFFRAERNYSPADPSKIGNTSGYHDNLLEIDANREAYRFIERRMGGWPEFKFT